MDAGIEALLDLVTHDKSDRSCSLADHFSSICQRGVIKRISLYRQRRFAKLGKAAASLLEALPVLRKFLDETKATNQLVEACRIYLASEIFLTELEVLAFFNHHATFPFLNCVERSNQADLVKMLPKLFNDLLSGRTDTLNEFIIHIYHVNVVAPTRNQPTSKSGSFVLLLQLPLNYSVVESMVLPMMERYEQQL